MSLAETVTSDRSRRQLVLTGVIAVIICGVLAAGYFIAVRSPYEMLFSGLRPADAATIVAELDKKKTPYKLKDGGATILVPANQVDSIRLGIVNADLPLKGGVGFELFNKSDIGLTEFAQKINYQRALQGELARTIMTMDGINSARVHLSLPDQGLFAEDKHPPKASVTILTLGGRTLASDAVWGIQRLVAAAVPDLEAADVVILDDRGIVISGEGVHDRQAAPAAPTSQTDVVAKLAVPQAAISPPQETPASQKPAPRSISPVLLVIAISLGAVLLGLIAAVLLQRPKAFSERNRRLTAKQRDDYVERLRTILTREETHA